MSRYSCPGTQVLVLGPTYSYPDTQVQVLSPRHSCALTQTHLLRPRPRPSTAPGLGVCEWSPEGLKDKSVSLITNTDEILKFVKKKMN